MRSATTAARRLIQPAIAPLYDSRSAHEVLALLAADGERDGHALLRRHWQASGTAAKSDFEAFWRDSLSNGVVRGQRQRAADAADRASARAGRRGAAERASSPPSSSPTPPPATAASPTTAGCRSCRARSRS